jgi:hypothetical protein
MALVYIVILLVEHNNAPQVKCADAQDCAVIERAAYRRGAQWEA